ncbi:hypothetical protein B0H14DRAFT_2625839 [Mycena olivaceomarginata]|nr:hypothetical protein B0H14DRAFT_2625839 [Mycena olivaceomarginata]
MDVGNNPVGLPALAIMTSSCPATWWICAVAASLWALLPDAARSNSDWAAGFRAPAKTTVFRRVARDTAKSWPIPQFAPETGRNFMIDVPASQDEYLVRSFASDATSIATAVSNLSALTDRNKIRHDQKSDHLSDRSDQWHRQGRPRSQFAKKQAFSGGVRTSTDFSDKLYSER